MSGEIARSLARPVIVLPGTTLGVTETPAGLDADAGATVTKPGRALRLDREPLFGILGDDVELMQGFSAVSCDCASRPAVAVDF
jgi:hypothetical protein